MKILVAKPLRIHESEAKKNKLSGEKNSSSKKFPDFFKKGLTNQKKCAIIYTVVRV